jgi:FkbM family methyltransferase
MTNDMPRSCEAHGHARVWQNGNPFSDAARMLAPTPITTVFDVGANCGDVAVHLLANFPSATVHAFEPNPAPFAHMVERFADEDRMVGIPAGVSDAPGTAELYVYGEDGLSAFSPLSAGSAAHLEGYGTDLVGTIEAELVTLDDYAAVEGIETVDLIKLDVQGWEVPSLRGATRLLSEAVPPALTSSHRVGGFRPRSVVARGARARRRSAAGCRSIRPSPRCPGGCRPRPTRGARGGRGPRAHVWWSRRPRRT